jgi:hypothetical protein
MIQYGLGFVCGALVMWSFYRFHVVERYKLELRKAKVRLAVLEPFAKRHGL